MPFYFISSQGKWLFLQTVEKFSNKLWSWIWYDCYRTMLFIHHITPNERNRALLSFSILKCPPPTFAYIKSGQSCQHQILQILYQQGWNGWKWYYQQIKAAKLWPREVLWRWPSYIPWENVPAQKKSFKAAQERSLQEQEEEVPTSQPEHNIQTLFRCNDPSWFWSDNPSGGNQYPLALWPPFPCTIKCGWNTWRDTLGSWWS